MLHKSKTFGINLQAYKIYEILQNVEGKTQLKFEAAEDVPVVLSGEFVLANQDMQKGGWYIPKSEYAPEQYVTAEEFEAEFTAVEEAVRYRYLFIWDDGDVTGSNDLDIWNEMVENDLVVCVDCDQKMVAGAEKIEEQLSNLE